MASLGGSAVIRHDLPLPLFGGLYRPPLPEMEEDLKKSVYDGFSCSPAVGSGTGVGCGPMMKACFWCGYASIRVSDLMTHMKTTHPLEYTANEAEMSGLPRVSGSASPAMAPLGEESTGAAAAARRYKCFSCEARFCRSGTLMDHMRRNHPETCVSLSDARRLSNGSVWSVASSNGMCVGTVASAAASAKSPRPAPTRLLSSGGSESCSPAAGGLAADASADAFSRKRMLQRAMSSTADDDEDDDELDIKVIRLVKQRLAAGDNCGGRGISSSSSEMPFFGKLHASSWPGHLFRSAAAVRDGFVERQDLGCLLGALHSNSSSGSAACTDSSGHNSAVGVGSCIESAGASGSEGDCSSGGGSEQQQAGVGSIRVVRVSGVHASIVAGGRGGSAGMEMAGGGGAASSSIGSVASSGLRAPEKYKCFWCDAHFRKRGKLMDHIDLFHKDSKQQTEVQAELLSNSGGSGSAAFGSESKQQLQRSTAGQPDAAAAGSKQADSRRCASNGQQTPGSKLASPSGQASASAANCATVASVVNSAPSCRFFLRSASLSESEQPTADIGGRPKHVGLRLCKFYFGKLANPLTVCAGAHGSHGHTVGRAALGVPCSGGGSGMTAAVAGSGAASAVALNLGLALGPQSAAAAAFGPPYAAMYCGSGGPGGSSVRFYQQQRRHHHAKSNFAYAPAQSSAYQLAAGAILPPGLERLALPAPALQEVAAAGTSAAFLLCHRPQASGPDVYHNADSPLDLSSRNGRQ